MASSFEQLVFEIIATDKTASAAFDRFRQKVDQTSRSVDDNTKTLDKNSKSLDNVAKSAVSATPAFGGLGGVSGMGAGEPFVTSPMVRSASEFKIWPSMVK
jgi:ABC-type transporter Mla subunit MlaD